MDLLSDFSGRAACSSAEKLIRSLSGADLSLQ
jgi:hypothetical protein